MAESGTDGREPGSRLGSTLPGTRRTRAEQRSTHQQRTETMAERDTQVNGTTMPELLVDFITSLDG